MAVLTFFGAACSKGSNDSDSRASKTPVAATGQSTSKSEIAPKTPEDWIVVQDNDYIPVIDDLSRKLQSARQALMMKDPATAAAAIRASADLLSKETSGASRGGKENIDVTMKQLSALAADLDGRKVIEVKRFDAVIAAAHRADLERDWPRRPWEACGTSGMKVLVNGGINLSELDGWWAEAYTPEVGWALGDGQEHGDDPAWDATEAEALYDLLEREVIPEFYTRGENGIPAAWVARMRESMARLTPVFAASRAVREYTEQHYLPAAAALRSRVANKGASGGQIAAWRHSLEQKWGALRFGQLKAQTQGGQHLFEVQVYLHDLDPKSVQTELYADGVNGGSPERQEMKNLRPLAGVSGGYVYSAAVSAARPVGDYTARVIPRCDGVAIPLEAAQILWQRG